LQIPRALFALACLPFLALAAPPAALGGERLWELKIGGLAHDVNTRFGSHVEDDSLDVNVELVLPPFMPFLGGALHPAVGGTINTAGGTSHAYIDARWQIETPAGVFFALGVGAAVHDGNLEPTEPDRKALGSRVLFHLPAEVGLRLDEQNSVSLYFEHTSNAGLADHNGAMDRVGIRYGYRF
jgi:hypothetical protein